MRSVKRGRRHEDEDGVCRLPLHDLRLSHGSLVRVGQVAKRGAHPLEGIGVATVVRVVLQRLLAVSSLDLVWACTRVDAKDLVRIVAGGGEQLPA